LACWSLGFQSSRESSQNLSSQILSKQNLKQERSKGKMAIIRSLGSEGSQGVEMAAKSLSSVTKVMVWLISKVMTAIVLACLFWFLTLTFVWLPCKFLWSLYLHSLWCFSATLHFQGYPLKILLKRTRGLIKKEDFFLVFLFAEPSEWYCIESCKWGALGGPLGIVWFSLYVCFAPPSSFLTVFSPSVLLLASIMAESSCCFQTCNRNSVCRFVGTLAFTCTVGGWWSQWGNCHHTWYCWWSHNKWKSVTFVHAAYVHFCFLL